MWKKILVLVAFLALARGQGYGNLEDDSSPQKPLDSQQQISSLPQYDPDPALEGYGPAPSSNLQANPNQQTADQSQNQDYWWLNQNAFQKPAGHPGVEQLDQSKSPQPQQQGNRNPNSYNPPQNSYNQPQPQPQKPVAQAPYKPQNNQFQQNSPSFGSPSRPSQPSNGGGWSAPSQSQPQQGFNAPAPAQPTNFNLPAPSNSLGQPSNNGLAPLEVAPECMLLNKADCHKSGLKPGTPSNNNFQQGFPEQSGSGYNQNVPKPPQSYKPLQPKPQQQPQPQQNLPYQEQPAQPPAGYYQPPQSPQPQQPNRFESNPQNYPSNQNTQPQYTPDSQPASSFPAQNQQTPSNKPYQQKPYQGQSYNPPAPQQQYNKPNPPAPQQNTNYNRPQAPAPQKPTNFGTPARPFQPQSQFQNNGQGINPNQQPNNYDDQLPYPGCPAAMLCVSDDRCNLIGIIEEAPIRLSEAEKIHRVALSRCSEPSTGVEGVCCRDPNYKDPWPDMQGNGGDHQHHHGGDHHTKGQGQGQFSQPTKNNFQPQSQTQSNSQPGQQPFRNPYAGSRGIGGNKGCGASY